MANDARAVAHRTLTETLRRRRPLDAAFEEAVALQPLSVRDSGFARTIANETMRRFGQLDDLVRRFVPRAPPPHRAGATLEILLAGACELLFLAVPAHAAVDGANRLAAADPKAVHFKGLVNAALRRIALEGPEVLSTQDALVLNTPDWLWTRWCEAYNEETVRAIASAHLRTPPLDIFLRPSCDLASSRTDDVATAMSNRQPAVLPGGMVRLERAGSVQELPGFREGEFWVQDFAASLPVRLFGDLRGRCVIDLCAAPGGKTAQLVCGGAHVTAVEKDQNRLARLAANLDRVSLSARLVLSDVRDFRPDRSADCVLLDAPCSSTGTIRRHPELPWIKTASDIAASTGAAGELLDAASTMVAPRGQLVFAVCSLEPEEGPEQVAHFLRRRSDFRRVPIVPAELFELSECIDADGDLRSLPCHLAERGGMDGFYAARLMRL